MRRARRLSRGERFELGVFLGVLLAGCIGLAAIFHLGSVSNLAAFAFEPNTPAPSISHPGTARETPSPRLVPPSSPLAIAPARRLLRPLASAPELVPVELRPDILPGETEGRFIRSAGTRKLGEAAEEIRWFKGEKYRFARTLRLRVTAYAPDARCCWPYPGTTTASGMSVKTNHGRLVAADTNVIPLHALVSVPGYDGGKAVPVLDRGGAIKGNRLDVLLPTYDQAKAWGTRVVEVKVWVAE